MSTIKELEDSRLVYHGYLETCSKLKELSKKKSNGKQGKCMSCDSQMTVFSSQSDDGYCKVCIDDRMVFLEDKIQQLTEKIQLLSRIEEGSS